MIIRQVLSQILSRPSSQLPGHVTSNHLPGVWRVERLDNLLVRSMEGWRVDAVTRKHQLVTSLHVRLILSAVPASASHI